MPRVKIDYVVSFSSEDPEHPASNLLNREVSKKKWLCKKGEASCSVVLQLAKAVKISAVHIGAYHAALVEVLVARSETSSEQFQVLVPSSVFLSREESRRDAGLERVRSFSAEQLSQPAREQRWDRLRIVAQQPYNKHCKYGVSFIHIDEAESAGGGAVGTGGAAGVARRLLTLDTFSSDEDEFKPGELFAKHLQKNNTTDTTSNTHTNTGAQIRQATSQALKNIPESSTKLMKTPISKPSAARSTPDTERAGHRSTDRSRDTLLYTRDDEQPHDKIDRVLHRHHEDKRRHDTNKHDKLDTKHNDKTNVSSTKPRDSTSKLKDDKNIAKITKNDSPPRNQMSESRPNKTNDRLSDQKDKELRKRKRSDSQEQPGPVSEEPHTLLSGAVLVLSGYENPRRAQVRATALALGARVQRDWAPHCTHLICAFPNTPKLRAVRRGAAPLVPAPGAAWLQQCAARRRLLPWRWFAAEPHLRIKPTIHLDSDEPDPAATTPPPPTSTTHDNLSDEDTDDEIEKVLQQQKKRRLTDTKTKQTAVDEETDTDMKVQCSDDEVTEAESDDEPIVSQFGGALPDLFRGRTLAIDTRCCPPAAAALVSRYVRAHAGLVLQMSAVEEGSEVDYVVRARSRTTADGGPPSGVSPSGVCPSGVCPSGVCPTVVTPAWLRACFAANTLLPPPAL